MPNWIRKWLHGDLAKARKFRNEQRKRNYERGRENAYNNSKAYSEEEIRLIIEHKVSDRELAAQIGRSVNAIQAKRSRLNANEHKRTNVPSASVGEGTSEIN